MAVLSTKPAWAQHEAFSVLDSQNYLVRHRRNRVYGIAAVNTASQVEEQFQDVFKSALSAMMTNCHFTMDQSFLRLPKEIPHLERVKRKLREALEDASAVSRLRTKLNFQINLFPYELANPTIIHYRMTKSY